MMGPDASSCLDLDECTIDPEVKLFWFLPHGFLLNRFVAKVNARISWDRSNASATTVSRSRSGWKRVARTTMSVSLTSITATPLPSVRTQMGRTTAFVVRDFPVTASAARLTDHHTYFIKMTKTDSPGHQRMSQRQRRL